MAPRVDRELVRRAWILWGEGYTQEQIGAKIGISTRMVQYYHSEEWLAKKGLLYVKHVPSPERLPVMPIQQEPFDRCQIGDHSWMKEDRFKGLAYTALNERKRQVARTEADDAAMWTTWQRKVCYFCDLEIPDRLKSGAVYLGRAAGKNKSESKISSVS